MVCKTEGPALSGVPDRREISKIQAPNPPKDRRQDLK